MNRLSLRLRLALAGAAAIVLALGLAALGLAALFATHVERRAIGELSVQLDQVLAGLERQGDGALVLARPPADPRFARPYGGLYWQIEAEGRVLRSRSLWDYALPLPPDELGAGAPHHHALPGPDGGALLVLERSARLPEALGATPLRAAVAMEYGELVQAKRAFLADMTPYLALLALVLAGAGWAQLVIGLRPLRRLGARVGALRAGDAKRMGADWPREVQPLAEEIDALLAERNSATARARARAGDLAHGLKTPLQALMGETSRLRDSGQTGPADSIDSVADAMCRHVERELARTRSAARARNARADVALVAARVISVLMRTPDGARLDWHQSVPEGLTAALDESDLAEALGALAENAARHARNHVTLTASALDVATLRIDITDDGPGIPEHRLAGLTARGARLDESDTGSGLGLAIARDIAEAAGGQLTLDSSSAGLSASLTLPRA